LPRYTKLILATTSPRRAELLRACGFEFTQTSPHAEEVKNGEPHDIVRVNARLKARAAAAELEEANEADGALILAADTIVVLDGVIFGKPADSGNAYEMLCSLSGRTHEVHTGVCLLDPKTGIVSSEDSVTRVTFARLAPSEIRRYIETGDPLDKAGAYGIQGMARMFVERVEGSWDSVMGLPTALIRVMLIDMEYYLNEK
jgi:septum formation protein